MTSADTTASTLHASPAEPRAEARGFPLRRWLAPFAVAIALLSAFLTFVVLTGLTPIEPTPEVVRSFLLINAGSILLLVGIIVREVWQMVQARRRGRAAARLHVQIVGLFSVIAVLPAVLVSIVANVTIERGLDRAARFIHRAAAVHLQQLRAAAPEPGGQLAQPVKRCLADLRFIE